MVRSYTFSLKSKYKVRYSLKPCPSSPQLALYVLSFLEPKDLLRAAQTCRYWRLLAEDNLLWREKCREESIDETLVFGPRLRRKSAAAGSPWKALYMRQHQIEQNWRRKPIRPFKVSFLFRFIYCLDLFIL